MKDKQLDYFIGISEAGSFRRAAETLHIAQPALSRQMKQLEEDLGVSLFFRESNGVSLTPAGTLLLERARFLKRHREQTRADVTAKGTLPSGSIGFGAPPSIADILFQPLAESYLRKYPDVRLCFYDGVGHLHQWLLSGEIDLAILPNSRVLRKYKFSSMQFLAEPIYLVGSSGELDHGSSVTPMEVIKLPLILTAPPSTVRGLIDRMADLSGEKPRVVAETESAGTQKKLVASRLGYAILPHSAVYNDYQRGELSLSRIEDWKLQRVLAWRADRPVTPALSKMIDHICLEMKRLASEGAFGGPVAKA